jgi:hypothetical protein
MAWLLKTIASAEGYKRMTRKNLATSMEKIS